MKFLNMSILAAALCFSLAGCGGAPSGAEAPPEDTGEAPTEMAPAETAPPLEAP
jgi:hypothetical protein